MASKSSIEAGRGHVTLGTDSGPLESGLRAAEQKFKAWGQSIAVIGAAIATAGALATAPFLHGLSVLSEVGGAVASAARVTGMATGDIQTLASALKVDFDTLATGSRKMDQFIAQAAAGSPEAVQELDRLHLSLSQLGSMSEADRFRAVGAAIGRTYGDIAQRHDAALRIFGRGGLQFDFSGDVGAREQRLGQLGGVVSPADLALSKEYNLAVKEMNTAIQGLWARIGATAAPAMREFFELITNVAIKAQRFVDENREMLGTIFRVADAMVTVGTLIVGIGGAFYGASVAIGFFMPMINAIVSGIGILTGALAFVPFLAGAAAIALGAFLAFGALPSPEVEIDINVSSVEEARENIEALKGQAQQLETRRAASGNQGEITQLTSQLEEIEEGIRVREGELAKIESREASGGGFVDGLGAAYSRLAEMVGAPVAGVIGAIAVAAAGYALLTAGVTAWGWASAAAGGVASAATWAWGWAAAGANAVAGAATWVYGAALSAVTSGFGIITLASWAWSIATIAASGVATGAVFAWGIASSVAYGVAAAAQLPYQVGLWVLGAVTGTVAAMTWLYNAAVAAGSVALAIFSGATGGATGATGGYTLALIVAWIWENIVSAGAYLLVTAIGLLVIAFGGLALALPLSLLWVFISTLASSTGSILGAAGSIGSAFTGLAGTMSDSFSRIVGAGTQAFNGIADTAIQSFGAIKDAISAGDFTLAFEIIKTAGFLLWLDLKDGALAIWPELKDAIDNVWHALVDGLAEYWDEFILQIKLAWNTAVTKIRAEWAAFEARINSNVWNAAENAANARRDVLAEGINERNAMQREVDERRQGRWTAQGDREREQQRQRDERNWETAEGGEISPERAEAQRRLDDLSIAAEFGAMTEEVNRQMRLATTPGGGDGEIITRRGQSYGTFSGQAALGFLGASMEVSESPIARQARLAQAQIELMVTQHAEIVRLTREVIAAAAAQFG